MSDSGTRVWPQQYEGPTGQGEILVWGSDDGVHRRSRASKEGQSEAVVDRIRGSEILSHTASHTGAMQGRMGAAQAALRDAKKESDLERLAISHRVARGLGGQVFGAAFRGMSGSRR